MLELSQFLLKLSLNSHQGDVILMTCMFLLSAYLAIKVLLNNTVELNRSTLVPFAYLMRSVVVRLYTKCLLNLFLFHQMLVVIGGINRLESFFAVVVLQDFNW